MSGMVLLSVGGMMGTRGHWTPVAEQLIGPLQKQLDHRFG
jgi:hypothetical protein